MNWQHYVIAIDNDSMRMYIGGQKQYSMYKGFALNYTSDLIYIGQSGNTTYPGNLNGSVDDIRVYNRVLNDAEVNDLFNEPNPGGTTIREIAQKNIITLYPNPAKSLVSLSIPCNIVLTDITGKVVYVQQNTDKVDLTHQPAGVYFITLSNLKGELIQRSKLIKE